MRGAMHLSLVGTLTLAVAACGGGGRGPGSAWEKAPAPVPDERIPAAVLSELAGDAVAGFEPVGPSVGRELAEGEQFTHRFEWQEGRCFAAVAGALGGIEALDVWLMTWGPSIWPPERVASGHGTGSPVIAGRGDACFPADFQHSGGAVVVRAAKGAGYAAVQLYAR